MLSFTDSQLMDSTNTHLTFFNKSNIVYATEVQKRNFIKRNTEQRSSQRAFNQNLNVSQKLNLAFFELSLLKKINNKTCLLTKRADETMSEYYLAPVCMWFNNTSYH